MATFLNPTATRLSLVGRADLAPTYDPYHLVYEGGAGVTGANAYGTVEQARAYFIGKRLHSSAWTVASRETQIVALKQASALLDSEFTWTGTTPVNEAQGLAWPFTDATDRYGNAVMGVPRSVREATFELAFYLLAQERLVGREGVGLTSLRVDVISLVFDKTDTPQTIPPHVSRMLVGIGNPVRSAGTIRTVDLKRV